MEWRCGAGSFFLKGVFESEDEVWKWLGWLTGLCTLYMKGESGVDWIAGKLEEGLDFRLSGGVGGAEIGGMETAVIWLQSEKKRIFHSTLCFFH